MFWHQVAIEKEKQIADIESRELITKVDSAYRNAGLPEGMKVYHRETASGGHIYYFNPAAALVAREILPLFHASECSEVPNLEGCELIRF